MPVRVVFSYIFTVLIKEQKVREIIKNVVNNVFWYLKLKKMLPWGDLVLLQVWSLPKPVV